MVPAQEKFARFRSVQKCTFLVFRPKFDGVPPKIFLSENNSLRQNSIFFLLMPFKKSFNLPFGRDGQKTQGQSDQKLLFFLFFSKNDIKTLFEWCNQETFNFWNNGFFCQFQSIDFFIYSRGKDTAARTKSFHRKISK